MQHSAGWTLPTGEVVEVTKRRVPLYTLARELAAREWPQGLFYLTSFPLLKVVN